MTKPNIRTISILNIKVKEPMTKTVVLTLETASIMYNSGSEALKKFAVENYPELENITGWVYESGTTRKVTANGLNYRRSNVVWPTLEMAMASRALAELIYKARRTGVCNRDTNCRSVVISSTGEVRAIQAPYNRGQFRFDTASKAQKFMEDNKQLILLAAPLL